MKATPFTSLLLSSLLSAAVAQAQEPATRAEALAREREAKAHSLQPYEPGKLERALLLVENDRVFERLLNPPEGFYPKIGNVTAGSGLAVGPAYRRTALFGDQVDFSAYAAGSLKKYWLSDARIMLPRLADGRIFVDLHAQRFDFPQEDFFGLGPDSARDDHVTYGFENATLGATGGVRPTPWLSFGTAFDRLTPRIAAGSAGRSIEQVFGTAAAPGLAAQPPFARYRVFAEINYREPRGNPRRGGRYALDVQSFDDRDAATFDFRRVDADLQQYIPFLNERRVIALHVRASTSDPAAGAQVPFYFQPTLGGPDDLRGFRRYRFRDEHVLLLQAEYRWEIFTALDGAIFYDAGKVASRRADLDFRDLQSDYGIGFRFGTINSVFLRIEAALGSSGGPHFVLRFGHVF